MKKSETLQLSLDMPTLKFLNARAAQLLSVTAVMAVINLTTPNVSIVKKQCILMATMLTGAAVMDACLLLIAGNMSCP
jgi:translation initiation factor 2 gamma subunit (eIF-2gamma)